MNLRGYGIPGNYYDIQYSDDDMQTWQVLTTVQAAPSGLILYTDATGGAGMRFYRFAVQ